jgi:hypothetical protein
MGSSRNFQFRHKIEMSCLLQAAVVLLPEKQSWSEWRLGEFPSRLARRRSLYLLEINLRNHPFLSTGLSSVMDTKQIPQKTSPCSVRQENWPPLVEAESSLPCSKQRHIKLDHFLTRYSIRSVLILSSHLHLGLQSVAVPFKFSDQKALWAFLVSLP